MCRGLPLLDAPNGALAQKSSRQQAAPRLQQWDDEFLQYTYKVVPCDKTWRHEYSSCPFAHPGESSERRHPSAYLPFMCGSTQHSTDLKEKCPFGTACKYAHGHFELWLHPGRFRTKMCSLGENCRRAVCFFAHSEQELRVTPYSKLDTAAVVAVQQLSQMGADGAALCAASSSSSSPCGSVSGSNAASSVRSDSSDGSGVKSALVSLSSPCGSEAGGAVRGSPAGSEDLTSALTAGMVFNQQQTAMLEMQLQGNTSAALLAADAAHMAASTAPAMWLGGSGAAGLLPQQLPAASMAYSGVLPQQQQLVYLDAASNAMGFAPGAAALPAAAGTELMNGWMLAPNAASAAMTSLSDQWVGSGVLAAAQQRTAAYGGLGGAPAGFSCAPAAAQMRGGLPMSGMLGGNSVLDQWLQLQGANAYGAPPGLNRSALGCGISAGSVQQQPGAANARMAQLLSTLPDQAVQQLLGMLAVDAPGA